VSGILFSLLFSYYCYHGSHNNYTNLSFSSLLPALSIHILSIFFSISYATSIIRVIIGENDPSFKFDTIEISPEELANTTPIVGPVGGGGDGGENTPSQQDQLEGAFEGTMESGNIETGSRNSKNKDGTDNSSYKGKKSWWKRLIEYLYGHSQSSNDNTGPNENTTNKPLKTPFTKLSSFKFKKELGRGAFGRVLLAESKTDGSLYALKIISKKNMRSSDKRQAKTERDILHAMGQSNPHPFTTGLKFAFQSENNLYLGQFYLSSLSPGILFIIYHLFYRFEDSRLTTTSSI
jgi:hypothetical protein